MRKLCLLILGCTLGVMVGVHADDESPIGKQMEAMNDAYKAFRHETDPVKGAAMAREAQVITLKSALEVPTLIQKMPDGPEKTKASLEYRKMMAKLFSTFCEVEQAFIEGKIEDVAKMVESLKAQRKEGHDKFIEEDE